jgi:hypothetical protein
VSSGRHRGTSSYRRPGPFLETSKLPNSAGDRGFESISLQGRVHCEPTFGGQPGAYQKRQTVFRSVPRAPNLHLLPRVCGEGNVSNRTF